MVTIATLDHSTTLTPAACGFAAAGKTPEFPTWINTATLDAFLSLPSTDGNHKHPHKDVLRIECDSSGGPAAVYVKRQWAWDRRLPRWSDWRDGVSGIPDPVREYDGLRMMQSAGLSVPVPLQLLRDHISWSPRAALIMSAVPVEQSLAQSLRQGHVRRLNPFSRRGLILALMELSERLSGCGLRWRSMKARHIYPEQITADQWRLWLIDCEGVRPRATWLQHRRDRGVLMRSLQTGGADAAFLTAVESALFRRRGRRSSRSRAASRPLAALGCAASTGH